MTLQKQRYSWINSSGLADKLAEKSFIKKATGEMKMKYEKPLFMICIFILISFLMPLLRYHLILVTRTGWWQAVKLNIKSNPESTSRISISIPPFIILRRLMFAAMQ